MLNEDEPHFAADEATKYGAIQLISLIVRYSH